MNIYKHTDSHVFWFGVLQIVDVSTSDFMNDRGTNINTQLKAQNEFRYGQTRFILQLKHAIALSKNIEIV